MFSAKLNNEEIKIAKNNPHCLEYFITKENTSKYTQKCTKCSLVYSLKEDAYDNNEKYMKNELSKYKKMKDFEQANLIYKYDDLPYLLDYENTFPIPTTVIHWGQLKMFLTTFLFLIKVVKETDEVVNIIYPGSAKGDNILILCELFPNTRWYLIDPNKYHPKLYSHKQIIECKNELFTNKLAEYYYNKLKNTKLLFISDIRVATDDKSILRDQNQNTNWYTILKPNYAFLKFRCPYYKPEKYQYYTGKIYLQPYAPIKSTETRILLSGILEEKIYDIDEYIGRMFYFNRVLRPAYYKTFANNKHMDHCWDCAYFSYIVKNYIINFPNVNPYSTDVSDFISKIIDIIAQTNLNRLALKSSIKII
jgi:hypothetical protein